jgi:orotate phosphoribosyltransferase
MEKEKERLLELLKSRAYQKKKVILASGRESDFYIDCREVTLHPEGGLLVGKIFYNLLKETNERIDGIGAVPVGAIPIATAVSIISQIEGNPIPAFVIRKELKSHGTGKWIEGSGNLYPGARVVIVEDVITTGGSVIQAIEIAEKNQLKVILTLALVDREEGGRETIETRGYKLISLFRKRDFV